MDKGATASDRPASEASDRGRQPRRRARLILLGVVLWLAAAVGSLMWAGMQARSGLRAAERARDIVSADPTSAEALGDLHEAESRFRSSAGSAGAFHVAPLRVVPVLGRQIRSLDALAGGAARAAAVSTRALSASQTAVRDMSGGRAEAPALLRRLGQIADDADLGLEGIDLGPHDALYGPLGSARDRLASELADLQTGLRRGAAGARAAAHLLQGPGRYLVLAANNAEMRAGSGMFLSAGVLETNDGAFGLSPFLRTETLALPPGAVPLEGDLAARWGWLKPNEEWRNLAVSPRFDVTAPLAATMWEATGGGPVDGVLALDPVALRAILRAVGGVEVEGRTIGPDDVVDWILHGQYVEHAGDPLQDTRRDDLGLIAAAVMRAVDGRDWKADLLGRELAAAARGRHLLAWSAQPEEQEGWVAAGIDGSLREDSVMVGILNRGGNKLDRFLRVSADLQLLPQAAGTQATLRLTMRNETPPGEPSYVTGPEPNSGVGAGEYLGLVSVNLPADARDGRIEGENSLAVAGADGPTRVIAASIQIAPEEERTVVVRFTLPYPGGSLRIEPSARVPGVTWTSREERWQDGSAHTLRW